MSNFNINKQDGVSTLGANEWNQIAEINNLILSGGLTPDTNVVNQVAKSIANLVSSANFFTENGTANNYTLIASGSFVAPTSYINGMVIRFITTNANTTTTPTVNLAGLGAKNIKKANGNPVIAGDIAGYVELRYNGTDFLLSPYSASIGFSSYLSSNQIINKDIDTKINFSTAVVSRNDNSIFSTTTSRFTPTTAGWYQITCGLFFDAPVSPNTAFYCNAIIYKNGAIYKGASQSYCQNVSHEVINSFSLFMNGTTDYLELYGSAGSSNATYTILSGVSSYFQAFKI